MRLFKLAIGSAFLSLFLLLATHGPVIAVDTPRTQAYLLGSVFQDGQPAGSITPSDMRDLVLSTYGSATNNLNLKNYGLPTGGDDTAAINAVLAAALPASFTATGSIAPGATLVTSASTASGTTLPFTSTTGIVAGMLATATTGGTPGNAYVVSLVANTSVTLSAAVTSNNRVRGERIVFQPHSHVHRNAWRARSRLAITFRVPASRPGR
jgi:hypothetical protein